LADKKNVAVISVFEPDGDQLFYKMFEIDDYEVTEKALVKMTDIDHPVTVGKILTFTAGTIKKDEDNDKG